MRELVHRFNINCNRRSSGNTPLFLEALEPRQFLSTSNAPVVTSPSFGQSSPVDLNVEPVSGISATHASSQIRVVRKSATQTQANSTINVSGTVDSTTDRSDKVDAIDSTDSRESQAIQHTVDVPAARGSPGSAMSTGFVEPGAGNGSQTGDSPSAPLSGTALISEFTLRRSEVVSPPPPSHITFFELRRWQFGFLHTHCPFT